MKRWIVMGGLVMSCAPTPAPSAPPPAPPPLVQAAPAPPSAPTPAPPSAPAAAPAPQVETESCGARLANIDGAPWYSLNDGPPHPAGAVPLYQVPNRPALDALCEKLQEKQPGADSESFICFARPGTEKQGVWAILTEPVSDVVQRWRLAVALPTGKVVLGPKTVFSDTEDPAAPGGQLPSVGFLDAITDFDRDGEPEVITSTRRAIDSNATPEDSYQVWTLKKGRISPYAPAKKLQVAGIRDADGDGVPDLLVDFYGIQLGTMMGFSGASMDWMMLGHATADGRFSTTDAVAEKFARSLCPKPPEDLGPDQMCFAKVLHCGRLWGKDPKAMIDAVEKGCAGAEQGSLCDYSKAGWKKVATQKLPLTLK